MLQYMGSQRVKQDLATEQQQKKVIKQELISKGEISMDLGKHEESFLEEPVFNGS